MRDTISTRRFSVRARRCPCQRASTMAANTAPVPHHRRASAGVRPAGSAWRHGTRSLRPTGRSAAQARWSRARGPLFRRETVLPLDHGRGDQITLPGQDQIVRRCGEPGQVPGEGLGCEILRPQDRSKRRSGGKRDLRSADMAISAKGRLASRARGPGKDHRDRLEEVRIAVCHEPQDRIADDPISRNRQSFAPTKGITEPSIRLTK